MIPKAAELFENLESRKERFVTTLEALSPEQLDYRSDPKAWTPVQVGHHVVLAEQRTANSIKKHRGIRSGKPSLRYRVGNAMLWLVFKTGLRVKNPVPEAAPDDDIDLARLLEAWDTARGDLEAVLAETKERGLEYAAFNHPIGGPFNVEQALEFLVAHLDHHLRQLDRIQRHPTFPTSA
jgi:hypothetical protein